MRMLRLLPLLCLVTALQLQSSKESSHVIETRSGEATEDITAKFYDINFVQLESEWECEDGRVYFKDVHNNASHIDDLLFGYECVAGEESRRLRFSACYPENKHRPVRGLYAASNGLQYLCTVDQYQFLGVMAKFHVVGPNSIQKIDGSLWETVYKHGQWRTQMISRTCVADPAYINATRFNYECVNHTKPVLEECTHRGGSLKKGETLLMGNYEVECSQKEDEMCFHRTKCDYYEHPFDIGENFTNINQFMYMCIKENGHASRVYVDISKGINKTCNGHHKELHVVVTDQIVTGCLDNGDQYEEQQSWSTNGVTHICKRTRYGQLRPHATGCLINGNAVLSGKLPDTTVENALNACEMVQKTATPVYKGGTKCQFAGNDDELLKKTTSSRGEKVTIDAIIGVVTYQKSFVCTSSSREYFYFKPRGCILDDVLIPIFQSEQAKADGKYYECRLNEEGHPVLIPGLDYFCTYKDQVIKHYDEDGDIAYAQDDSTGTVYGCDFGKLVKKYCFDDVDEFWPGVAHSSHTGETRVCQEKGEGYFVSSFPGCFLGGEIKPFGASYVIGDLQYQCELQAPKADLCEEQPRATVCGCNDSGDLKELFTLYHKDCSQPDCVPECKMCTDKGIKECTQKAKDCWDRYGTINCDLCDTCGNKTATLPPPRVTKATTPKTGDCECVDKLPFCNDLQPYCVEEPVNVTKADCATNADIEDVVTFTTRMCMKTCQLCGVSTTPECANCKTLEFVNATGLDCGRGEHSVCAVDEILIEYDERVECDELPNNQKQREVLCPVGYDAVFFLQNGHEVVTDEVTCKDDRTWVPDGDVEKMTCRKRCTTCVVPLSKNCPSFSECTEPVVDTTKSCIRLQCPSGHRMLLDNSQKSDIGRDLWYSPEIPLAVCNGSSFVTQFDLPITCEKVDCTPFSDTCDEGWATFGDACFKFFDTPMTWTEAEANCNSLRNNSHLASIHNAKENVFIYDHLKYEDPTNRTYDENAWLGMRKVDSEVFQWSNGQIVNYFYWNYGEPTNLFLPDGKTEGCVQLLIAKTVLGSWNDYVCETTIAKHVCRYNLKDDACFE